MKKGFTLIELLAVIVILAIIALIAVPIVINIIDESKKNATLRSAEMYMDAVELSIANRVMNHGAIPNRAYDIMSDGNICLSVYDKEKQECGGESKDDINNKNVLKVEVKGEKLDSGKIIIEKGQIVNELNIDKYLDAVKEKLETAGTYYIMGDGNICIGTLSNNTCTGNILEIEVDIAKPSKGTITIDNTNVTISEESKEKTKLKIKDQTIIKNEKNEWEIQTTEPIKLCTANTTKATARVWEGSNDPGLESSYAIVEVGKLASVDGAYTPGVSYTCNFIDDNEENNMTFFVLSETEDTVTLISGANLDGRVAWSEDGSNHADKSEEEQAVTAKAALAEKTSNWLSANGGKLNEDQSITIKLPTAYQIAKAVGQTFSGSTITGLPTWLTSHTKAPVSYGYLTSTPDAGGSSSAWAVCYSGSVIPSPVTVGNVYGYVRPVITLSKSNI